MRINQMLIAAVTAAASLTALPGCAVTRDQSTVGEYIDDATITTKVKAVLAKDPDVKAYQVNVETQSGVVQLSGFVDSETSIRRAGELARQVTGVRSVKNDIRVKPVS